MQRNFLRGFLICLIPCLLAALFALRPEKYRLGIDLAGGTILVYEVNLERTKQRKEAIGQSDPAGSQPASSGPLQGLSSEEMQQLAHQIKRRIDPTDIKNVTVRPLGGNRIEIILPTGGAATGGRANLSAEDIEEVKRLISQMGVLEFRILANGFDDQAGVVAARDEINAKIPEELKARAEKGLAPEGPGGNFNVDIGETKANVKYVWTELGPEQRESLGLSNAAEGSPGGLWGTLAAQRDKAVPSPPDIATCAMLLYSRKCISVEQLAKEKMDFDKLKRENPGKSDEEIEKMMNRKKYEYFVLTRVSTEDSLRVGGEITLTANADTDPKTFNPCVSFRFNSAGGQQFGKITRRNKPTGSQVRQLAILLDDRVVSAPTLQGEITNIGQITGRFDKKSVDRLVQILRSGALSAELREKPVSENTIGPTLGADTIRRGTTAVGMAFIAVLVFMVIYYRFAGLVACIALFANLLLTIGFMVAVNAAFTLPGLAGLVLTLGMAVDANVLIYERLREERNKGANIATALRNGYERAFLTIIDTHLTSIFTAIVLYTFGNDQLKGFAISLTVGLVISLFTSLYMTRLMFDFWLHKKWLTELKMMRLFERPNFHPMRFRWFFFPLTGFLTILGLGLFLHRGESALNVDFRGGTVFAGKLKPGKPEEGIPGEERGLTTTPDGKPGFRELFGEEAQTKRLEVNRIRLPGDPPEGKPDVFWENEPRGTEAVNVWEYTIGYVENGADGRPIMVKGADGKDEAKVTRVTVTLTAPPAGATPEQMAQDVAERASHLPDVSVEQMFLSGETYETGKSRYFTVRTTEKQPALVRVSLDRLLRDDAGNSLMDGATMTPGPINGSVVELTFSKPTSRNFIQELLEREFKKLGHDITAETFTLTGVGVPVDGRFTKMTLDVSRNPRLTGIRPDAQPNDPDRQKNLESLTSVVNKVKQAFDGTPEPERLEVFDSQLASETREKAMIAILVSWLAIILYLWFRFGNWTFGLAAVICLVHDLCFTLGAIAICHYLVHIPGLNYFGIEDFKIDLAAVAALLTLVGYSVNEIIVNFARVREVRGKNPMLTPQMINDSVNQTLSRTILTSMTVFLVSIVLYAFGGDGVHLFAFVMVMGVLVATYSSIFVACPLLLFLGEGHATAGTEEQAAADKDKEESQEEVVEG
ncbi:MAG: protein translocase subunit SecD [Planctomycetia bacterium]|nr:protein translocase subunit SecD [Planctomycetia bacterium]